MYCVCVEELGDSRCLQHDFTDAGHGAETVRGVLQRKGLVLYEKQNSYYIYKIIELDDMVAGKTRMISGVIFSYIF